MSNTGNHPAVFAGLLGGASWGVPTWAYAISLDQASSLASDSLVVQFLLGCMTGAAVASAAIGAASLVIRERERRAEIKEMEAGGASDADITAVRKLDEDLWSSSSPSPMHAQVQEAEEETTGGLEHVHTGQVSTGASARELSQATAQPETPRRARHAAVDPSSAVTQVLLRQATTTGRHFAQSAAPAASQAVRPAHAADARPAAKHAKHAASKPASQEPAAAAPVSAFAPKPVSISLPVVETPALNAAARSALADLPTIDSRRTILEAATTNVLPRSRAERVPAVAESSNSSLSYYPTDNPYLEAINRLTLRERIAQRTKSVREVLAERLNPEAMETIPQIRRADGSIDKVEPTWFDQNVVPTLATIVSKIDDIDEIDDTAPRDAKTFERKAPASMDDTVLMTKDGLGAYATSAPAEARASYISTRVSGFDLGMFPAQRSAEDLEHEDVFEVALAAMGENIRQEAPVFQDMVGGPSTIDDPEGLEGPTTLIPFRARNRRPSMADTAAYVDRLIDDEVSRGNQGTGSIRRHPKHAYLRVIEGGTSPLFQRQRLENSGFILQSGGRHFAPSHYAKEA